MITPDSINLRQSDRNIPDGMLQESINMQWRDGSNKPIPYRLLSGIDVGGFSNIIAHKVGDENQINILGFWTADGGNNQLYWLGKIVDGVYTDLYGPPYPKVNEDVVYSENLSFTILNGVLYFMSDEDGGEFYYQVQYNQANSEYESKDVYAWKNVRLNFYTLKDGLIIDDGTDWSNNVAPICGFILTRFTFVLKTGEEVLHSSVMIHHIQGVNLNSGVSDGDVIGNIHTMISLNPTINDLATYDLEFSGINMYCSSPYYFSKYNDNYAGGSAPQVMKEEEMGGMTQQKMNEPFYLVTSIEKPHDEYIMLYAGDISDTLEFYNNENPREEITVRSRVDMLSIAAGEVIPIDNFTHEKLYGTVLSYNGRLVLVNTKTIISTEGHIYNIGIPVSLPSPTAVSLNTEDGIVNSGSTDVSFYIAGGAGYLLPISIISYPSVSAESMYVPLGFGATEQVKMELIKSTSQNIAIAYPKTIETMALIYNGELVVRYAASTVYKESEYETIASIAVGNDPKYTSENRLQFSEVGEFSVFPAVNSYRVGEGRIVKVGSNNVNPENADTVSPFIIGTSDGVYTLNLDPTGANLVASITKTANIPFISAETLEIGGHLIFVSDKGLMAINNGNIENLTEEAFPDEGDGNFPSPNSVYENYDACLDNPYNSGAKYIDPSEYKVDDIVTYMRGAVFAYDGRRNNIWCSNPNENFSLVYSLKLSKWSMSTIVFNEVVDLFSIINVAGTEYYSRQLVRGVEGTSLDQESNELLVLSGEDTKRVVTHHLLTRPIKLDTPDLFKKIIRLIARCELKNPIGVNRVFSFGAWGKQDLNKNANGIPLIAINDGNAYSNDIRQDIPVGRLKGKYKSITLLLSGVSMPDSTIDGFDFSSVRVDDGVMR